MKVLFLSIGGFKSITAHDQYPDLLREFQKHGHEVYIVCANEKRYGLPTECVNDNGSKILRVRIGNITQSGLVEKGIATVLVGVQYKRAINKFFNSVKFDLILYTTPPITLVNVVKYLKKKSSARTYLILKDIFPQNAVDIGLMSTKGIKGLIYRYFRNQEKKLYEISDKIGTMSKANTEYVLKHNPEIVHTKVEECPNCLEIRPVCIAEQEKQNLREKYEIPKNKIVFVYGGNLGKPQDIPFIIKCIKACSHIEESFFWIVGNGTEYDLIEQHIRSEKPKNLKLSERLPKEEYDSVIASCDVGLIFLDHRFTIPNFPSRMLAYMQAGLPILACTDPNTDIGNEITKGKYGWWCESNNERIFANIVKEICNIGFIVDRELLNTALNKFSVSHAYDVIVDSKDGRF